MPSTSVPMLAMLAAAILVSAPSTCAYAVDGTGLKGIYFSAVDFTGTAVTRIDPTIDFSWDVSAPILPGIGPSYFSVLWTGELQAQHSETYTLFFASDDGSTVELNGNKIISNWGLHAATEASATVTLTAGTKYPIRIKYFQWNGKASARLSWSSASTPKAVIPTANLYPTGAQTPFAITSGKASRTSPAWLEGTVSESVPAITGAIPGHAATLTREGPRGWYLAERGVTPVGIPLSPSKAVHVDVDDGAGAGSNHLSSDLSWTVTDLASLPYNMTVLPIRTGDSLLLTAGAKGSRLELDTSYTGTFHAVHTGIPGQTFPVPFPKAGVFDVHARIDGVDVGHLTVVAVAVNLQGPIACEVAYQRIKDVLVDPFPAGAGYVAFTANDADWFDVSVNQATQDGERLNLLPFAPGCRMLEARLGDAHGPIIAQQSVDTFTLHTTAETILPIIAFFPDGSKEAQAKLTLTPLVPKLDVHMAIIVAGVTFADSTTAMNFSTNDFTKQPGGSGQYLYDMIRSPTGWPHFCHTILVTQDGIQINQPR